MRIALIHYHLRRGGVTSVIMNQAQALMEAGEDVLVIAGEGEPSIPGLKRVLVEELRYDRDREISPGTSGEELTKRAAELADAIVLAAKAHWGQEPDILHVHNPLIQKNSALLRALHILQEREPRLLLQNHDLAEDFRPDVYAKGEEYPINCHYAVINSRDRSFLHRAGLKSEGLHLLPNEVRTINATADLVRNRYLYPVRAIQRKNIGEAIFLSLFIPKGGTVAITLPPTTERDIRIYREWVEFARELGLPVEFELGMNSSLEDAYGSAQGIITTSVKEGFGFSYLEPWTAGRTVIGRRINHVCRDFESSGVQFDSLYSSLNIPMVYISSTILRKKMEQTMMSVYKRFGMDPPRYIIKMMGEDLASRDVMDFSRLDETIQRGIIQLLVSNQRVLRDIADINPFLRDLANWKPDDTVIALNQLRVPESYGREPILKLLRETYRSVLNTPVTHKIVKSILLELYLDPTQLSLVGVGND
ncbi:glycosyltransferase family 1 protein [Treponema primitia]|uniref:glycosyltransferase family 1 protein n=1 Tax=Treponema primitia TaxID=88058 RepID=UPI00397F3D13